MGLNALARRTRPAFQWLPLQLAILYFLADVLLNRLAFTVGWTIFWPLNGITIAILLLRNRPEWPAILLGVSLGIGLGEVLDGNPPGFEILQRMVSVLEVYLCAWILPRFDTFTAWLRRPFFLTRFLVALTVGPGLTGILAAILSHQLLGQPYWTSFNDWATSDALGIALTLPAFLSMRSPEVPSLFDSRQLPTTCAALMLAAVGAWPIFSVSRFSLLFLLLPILLLVEALLAFTGAAIALFGISLMAVYFTIHGYGPFGTWPTHCWMSRDVALQLFLGFNLVALVPASILSMERRRMSDELVATNAQLQLLASLDGLTGIANRRSLDAAFAREWKQAMRVETQLALLMVDIDFFKQFNDLYGHHAGDACLRTIAETLKSCLQRSQDLAARFGGEEFALLLPHSNLQHASDLAEKLRLAVLALNIPHDGSAHGIVTVSIGCAAAKPMRNETSTHLLQAADEALYIAKQVGRNCVQVSPLATDLILSEAPVPAP